MMISFRASYGILKTLRYLIISSVVLPCYIAAQTIDFSNETEYIKYIKNRFDRNEWEAGKQVLDKAIEEYSKDSDLRMLAGKYYLHFKMYDEARYQLNKSLQLNYRNTSTRELLINVETESKRYSSAICYINELLEVRPYDPGLWKKKIALYDLLGNYVDANRLRRRLNVIYPNDSIIFDDWLSKTENEANIKRKTGRLDRAIELGKELVEQEFNNVEYYLLIIGDYLKAGDQYGAMTYIERGLNHFPNNQLLIDKKIGVLAQQSRYDELLAFLEQQMKKGNSAALQRQYDYYLSEAAYSAKHKEPATLYGKILERNPADEEAFSYMFSHAMFSMQYEDALHILSNYRKAKGDSKSLSEKEVMVYSRMGNSARVASLTKQLHEQYPDDITLRESYASIMLKDAKEKMSEMRYAEAVPGLSIAMQYGDAEVSRAAFLALYNAYREMGNYDSALNILNNMQESDPGNPELFVKKADIYQMQNQYRMALSAYEQAIAAASGEQKEKYTGGYGELLIPVLKKLNEDFRYDEAMECTKRWLGYDPQNSLALQYAINISESRRNTEDVLMYARQGRAAYPDDVFFQIKELRPDKLSPEQYAGIYTSFHGDLLNNPFQKDLINAFAQLSEEYSHYLIKNKQTEQAFPVIDAALYYAPGSRALRYSKGLAFQSVHQFDSAYYYQSFYVPPVLEANEFRQHLKYLKNKSYHNEAGIYYLYSRFGDDSNKVNTIATFDYTHSGRANTYTARINYTGRESGKGYQLQAEWNREWNSRTRTRIDAAWANNFFPSIAANLHIYRYLNLFHGIEAGVGTGYRKLENDNLMNAAISVTKEAEPWRININFNNYILGSQWLYNLSGDIRYYLSSPKNYLTFVTSVGSSPDVDIIDYQFYNGFSVINTMVGAGAGYLLTKTISVGVLGTWYNYKSNDTDYKNLYNLYFNLNVAF